MEPRPARGLVAWFLRRTGYHGITLPPFGIYILPSKFWDERLIRHEQVHWQQAYRLGILKWYALTLWYLIRYGYKNSPLEREAREQSNV